MVTWVKEEKGQPSKGRQVSRYGNLGKRGSERNKEVSQTKGRQVSRYGNLGKRGSERNKEVSQTRGDKSVDMVTWVKEERGQPNKGRQVSRYGILGKRGSERNKEVNQSTETIKLTL